MKQPTEKQRQTLDVIAEFIAENNTAPTFAELRSKLGIRSNQTLIDRLDALIRKGFLTKVEGKHRSIILSRQAGEYIIARNRDAPRPNLVGYASGVCVESTLLANASFGGNDGGTSAANPMNSQIIKNIDQIHE
jgi:SOS-response transcriptional repressor LexA